MKKTLALVLSTILVVSLFSACGGAAPSQPAATEKPASQDAASATAPVDNKDPIRIGVIQPRSGSLAVSGEDSYWGTMIAIDMFNEAGGVNGRMIEAVTADTPDAAAAQSEVNRLVTNENLKVITGVYGSAIAEVTAGICNRNNVLYWEHISVLDRLTEQGYTSVFRVHISGSQFGEEAAKMAVAFGEKMNIKKEDLTIGVINENGDFGQSVTKGVLSYAEKNGLKVVVTEAYDSKTTDTTPVVLKLKDANPDIVIATSYINDGIDITKKSKTLNWAPKALLGIGSGYGLSAYPESLGQDAEGQIDLDPTNAPVLENLPDDMPELVAEFQKRFKAERGYDSPTVGYLTWQATWVLLNNVIKPVGGVDDLDKLIAAAKAIDIPVGALPTGAGVKFNEKGQNERCVIAAMQWTDGKLVTIYPDSLKAKEPEYIPMPAWSERFK